MTKRLIAIATFLAIAIATPVKANEGMWLPMLIKRLNQQNLQRQGLQLTPEEIYSVNNSSLKDAVVSFGGFCTGEIVSPQGLIMTNHHCGYDAISSHSTVEKDLLTNGFWAKNFQEEIPTPGLFVSFLVRMEDVTETVLASVEGISNEKERSEKAAAKGRELAEKAKEGTNYKAEVKSFFAGNEYYLFVYEIFNDVRLVGAPPSSIGKYGGDTDNWMWPRHTGDFSLFRVYSGPDGRPADYSPENIPMKPKHFLPISIEGIKEGDFTMTIGYPGSTDRYLSSWGVKQAIEKKNPTIVEIRDAILNELRADMKESDAVRIMYASKFAQIANYWKYFIGQTEQLKRNDVFDAKQKLEQRFAHWAEQETERKKKYGPALELLQQGVEMKDNTVIGGVYVVEAGLRGTDIALFAYRMSKQLEKYLEMPEGAEKAAMKDQIMSRADAFYAETNMPTDMKLFAVTHELYSKNVPREQQPAYMRTLAGKMDGKWLDYAKKAYAKSIYTDKARLSNFLNKPVKKTMDEDPIGIVARDLFEVYSSQGAQNEAANENLSKGNRLFQAGLREMNPGQDYYPDANSTMRISFGNVRAYEPKDATIYKYYTTMDGLLAKWNPNDDEFLLPEGFDRLASNSNNYGVYATREGKLPVNFISTNDITGGNSGSPVINGKGELIGIAFDGNWEAMSGDINFEAEVQRTISVDIRYVLWVMERYANARNLISELTLVGGRSAARTAEEERLKNAQESQQNTPGRERTAPRTAPANNVPIPTAPDPRRGQQTTPPPR